MKNKALTLFAAAALAAVAVSATQAVALKRVVKVGDVATYAMAIKVDFQGTPVDVNFDSVQTVTKVNADGSYVATETTKNMVVTFNGQQVDTGGADEEAATMTYAKDGSITKIESSMLSGDEHRLSNLTVMLWPTQPVDVKSKWESSLKGDSSKGTFDVTHTYEVLSRENVMGYDTFKIAYNAKESGAGDASSTGVAWVEIKTGLAIKIEGSMKNAPMQGMPMDATFTMTLKKS